MNNKFNIIALILICIAGICYKFIDLPNYVSIPIAIIAVILLGIGSYQEK